MNDVPPFLVAIPARYGSTRLPGKPLRCLGGEPLVLRVAQRALMAGAMRVVVATDDARVADVVRGSRVEACMTGVDHASGSDRLAECARILRWPDDAIVVNLQGDEPFVPVSGIRAVARALVAGDAPMATLAVPIDSAHAWFDPDCVKVVFDLHGHALYFSRAPVPWAREALAGDRTAVPDDARVLRHVGIYAYRAAFLKTFSMLSRTPLERSESLEQLRVLEHGYTIAVRIAPEPFPAGVDTEADLARAERELARGATPA